MREATSPRTGWRTFVAEMFFGQPPKEDPSLRGDVARAARTSYRRLTVGPDGVTWTSRRDGCQHIPVQDIREVRLVDLVYYYEVQTVFLAAVVLDHRGAVLLRVMAAGFRPKKELAAAWAPLGVPVIREYAARRATSFRRRWPEALSWCHAHMWITVMGSFVTLWVTAAAVDIWLL